MLTILYKGDNMKLTNSQEEYLKAIYMLSNKKDAIRVTDIAKKLNITKPSVNRGIKNLAELNMVNYKTYGGISLTNEGKEEAKKILRKFDITKLFLTEILNIDDVQAEEDAKAIKYALSEKSEEKLEEYVIKTLNLEDLKCNWNMENEKCRSCVRVIKNKKGE